MKIKIGESWGAGPPRPGPIALARSVVGHDVELYVDANGGYRRSRPSASATGHGGHGVTWFEEPVSSDDLAGLQEVRDRVAPDVPPVSTAKTSPTSPGCSAAEAVDCLQVDVTRCGGFTVWLRAAAVAARQLSRFPGTAPPTCTPTFAAAIPNLRHLEYFHDHHRIEQMLFDGALPPDGGALRPDQHRPGLGLEFKYVDGEQYRVG